MADALRASLTSENAASPSFRVNPPTARVHGRDTVGQARLVSFRVSLLLCFFAGLLFDRNPGVAV